jgi:putative transposase
MDNYRSASHTKWECLNHCVWIPKNRKKKLFLGLRQYLGPVFRDLARQKACDIVEGHLMPDHVHVLLSVPPKYSVAQVVGYLKGKSAMYIARTFGGRKRNFTGSHFWARGYWVSTVGHDEQAVREYIRQQEAEDRRLDQLTLCAESKGDDDK